MIKFQPFGSTELRALLPLSSSFQRFWPLLLGLAVVSSFVEALMLSLVVILLGLVLGDVAPTSGLLGRVYDVAQSIGAGSGAVAALLVLFVLARSCLGIAYGLLGSHLRHATSDDMRSRLFAAYLAMPFLAFGRASIGLLNDALALHSWAVADGLIAAIRVLANVTSALIFFLCVALLSPAAAICAVIGSTIVFGGVVLLSRHAKKLGEKSLEANANLTQHIIQYLQATRIILAFGREGWARRRFAAVSRRARHRYAAVDQLQTALYPIAELGALATLLISAAASAAAGVPTSDTLAAIVLLFRVQPTLRELERSRLALSGHSASVTLVRDLLAVPAVANDRSTKSYDGLQNGICFDHVSFAYNPATPALENVTFRLSGEGVTILRGPSGAGKSTIVNLILCLYLPDSGNVRIGDVSTTSLDRHTWLSRVALAGQDADLITGTIADNIRFGKLNADTASLWRAAEAAGIASTIRAIPEGMGAMVGERGVSLSGGQRQRIGIARALVRDPDLLILDEATSAVEPVLSTKVLRKILEVREGRMTLIITHHDLDLGNDVEVIDLSQISGVGGQGR